MNSPTVTADHDVPLATPGADASSDDTALIDDELLVEEISIDGMCGVY